MRTSLKHKLKGLRNILSGVIKILT